MPRTNYVPDRHRPVGYAMAYVTERPEDKPTVEVDTVSENMTEGLLEAVSMALELWNPVFDHWEAPPAKSGEIRKVPVFRGKFADKVTKFRSDVAHHLRAHPEPDVRRILRIASKYVHVRPMTRQGDAAAPHFDMTPYTRDVIRPLVRQSDPEWMSDHVLAARRAYLNDDEERVNKMVMKMLHFYDERRGTTVAANYGEELITLINERAPRWEFWRLVAYYVGGIVDSHYRKPEEGLA